MNLVLLLGVQMSRGIIRISILIVFVLAAPLSAWTRPADFGQHWVQNNPYYITAVHYDANVFDMTQYVDANLNVFLPYGPHVLDENYTLDQNVPMWIAASRYELTAEIVDYLQALAAFPGITGWYVYDEPNRQIFEGVGEVANWLEEQYPDQATFSVAFPNYATAAQLWGDDTNPGYTYIDYIRDYINIIDPDFAAYDFYPFWDINHPNYENIHPQYYNNLMIIRDAAQSVGKPFLSAIQAYSTGQNQQGMRLPSESDVRLQAFSYLASGYDALGYFTYNYVGTGAMMDLDGNPTELYYHVQELNAELLNLGYAMRFLVSTDFRFLPGQYQSQKNPTPIGMKNWTPLAGGDTHIQYVGVDLSDPNNEGDLKNGLIGFFTDDNDNIYFLPVNAYHLPYTSAADTTLDFYIKFDDSITELRMLNRLTGLEEVVPLTNHILYITLPGGTGNLYKYNTGGGPPGPRPAAAPTITQQPQSVMLTPDGTARLTVAATSQGTLTYQWQKDGQRLGTTGQYSGSTSSTLTIANADPNVIGDYSCIVTNEAGSATSNSASISLIGPIAYDSFTNVSPGRDAGDPLVGTNTEDGSYTWVGEISAVFSDSGYITNTDGTKPRAIVPFTPNPSGAPVRAELYMNIAPDLGECWTSIGFMSGTNTIWNSGELLMIVRRDGRYTIFAERTVNNIANGQISLATENAYKRTAVEYDPVNNTASAWINDIAVLDNFDLDTIPYTPTITHVGFTSHRADSFPANSITVDNFILRNAQKPYMGSPFGIPGTIQAEDYDIGAEKIAYNDTTTGNTGGQYRTDDVDIQTTLDTGGGYNIAWIADGEWLEYTVDVVTEGYYDVDLRIASVSAGMFHIEMDGIDITGSQNLPVTGDWQTWTTVTVPNIKLKAGQQVLRLVVDQAGWNLNRIELTAVTPPALPQIAGEPQSITVCPCSVMTYAEFNITATGQGILQYAWEKDGVRLSNGEDITGADTATLRVRNLDYFNEGYYRCVVGNQGGSVISNQVTLTLNENLSSDLDGDCDVDIDDFLIFRSCMTGANAGPVAGGCRYVDFDTDDDIDQSDFGIFQRCYSGQGNPVDPNCE